MDRLDTGTGTHAVHDALDAATLLARIESLEKRQEHGEDVARRALAEELGRAVQSIGVLVDYLASRGLIDKADLQTHIERNFHITRLSNADGPYRGVIDVYGWTPPNTGLVEVFGGERPRFWHLGDLKRGSLSARLVAWCAWS